MFGTGQTPSLHSGSAAGDGTAFCFSFSSAAFRLSCCCSCCSLAAFNSAFGRCNRRELGEGLPRLLKVGYGTFTPRSAGAASCGRLDRIRRQPRQPTASFRWSTLESRDADKNLAANALFKTQVDAHRCLLASGWEKALPPGVENSSNLPKGNDDWYYHPTKRQPAKKSKNP